MDSILPLFCSVDDFWHEFAPHWQRHLLTTGRQRQRAGVMHPSEMLTILILFHQSHYRTFKAFYTAYVGPCLHREFPHRLSYSRFVAWMPRLLVALCAYEQTQHGICTGISFIASTQLPACHTARIHQHRVFAGHAERGKTSTGWFFGFKLHLVINDHGELLAWKLTPGNVDDRRPVTSLVAAVVGKLFGDKGYLSASLAAVLREQGVELVTKARKNMVPPLLTLEDATLLRKRSLIETVIDQLKHQCQIAHTRHRSPFNFLVNLVAGLIAYDRQPRKPSLHLLWNLLSTASSYPQLTLNTLETSSPHEHRQLQPSSRPATRPHRMRTTRPGMG
jgi:transposase